MSDKPKVLALVAHPDDIEFIREMIERAVR